MDQELKNVFKNIENNENDFNGNNFLKLLLTDFFEEQFDDKVTSYTNQILPDLNINAFWD